MRTYIKRMFKVTIFSFLGAFLCLGTNSFAGDIGACYIRIKCLVGGLDDDGFDDAVHTECYPNVTRTRCENIRIEVKHRLGKRALDVMVLQWAKDKQCMSL